MPNTRPAAGQAPSHLLAITTSVAGTRIRTSFDSYADHSGSRFALAMSITPPIHSEPRFHPRHMSIWRMRGICGRYLVSGCLRHHLSGYEDRDSGLGLKARSAVFTSSRHPSLWRGMRPVLSSSHAHVQQSQPL